MEFRGPDGFVWSCRDAQLWISRLNKKADSRRPTSLSALLSCGLVVLMESGSQPWSSCAAVEG